ncbi:MAG: cysteine hydrolase [Candidatus Yanofskybacteria bacterium]|nr:cysteine hydrolase [Candidatus Yanofskybacteria bacterium]
MTVATAIAQERPFPFLTGAQTVALTVAPFDALIVINPQNDFFPGGAKPIPQSEKILKPTRLLIYLAQENGAEVLVSARSYSAGEADHCISGTYGSGLRKEIGLILFDNIFFQNKVGSQQSCLSSYNRWEKHLSTHLYDNIINSILMIGMPTEECLKTLVLDTIGRGFDVLVAIDACAGFDKHESEKAIFEMKKAGAIITTSAKILQGRV